MGQYSAFGKTLYTISCGRKCWNTKRALKIYGNNNNHKAIIRTGGPGMAKTTIINRFEDMGYSYVPESGRDIIRREIEGGGTICRGRINKATLEACFLKQ